jgi:hypothetical protein
MNKKPEITIQYFVDRGRRRTVTLSLHRLHVVLVSVLVLLVWTGLATGLLVYHVFTGYSPFAPMAGDRPAGRASIVAVGPDQPQRTPMPVRAKDIKPEEAKPAEMKLAARAESPAAPVAVPAVATDLPMPLAHKEALLADLSEYESSLKEAQAEPTLKFSNVRISQKGDHLRVVADIDKLTGLYVEGHAFIAAEYVSADGKTIFLSSHGSADWTSATDPAAVTKATYFKARLRTKKRFDLVSNSANGAALKTLRLVARDKVTGQIIVEVITPSAQGLQ